MSKLNWRTAQLSTKRSVSVVDEAEHRDRDAASRWLSKRDKPSKKPVSRPSNIRGAA